MKRIISIGLILAALAALSVTQVSAANNDCFKACNPQVCPVSVCPPGCCGK